MEVTRRVFADFETLDAEYRALCRKVEAVEGVLRERDWRGDPLANHEAEKLADALKAARGGA